MKAAMTHQSSAGNFLRSALPVFAALLVSAFYVSAAPLPPAKPDPLIAAQKEIARVDSLSSSYTRETAELKAALQTAIQDSFSSAELNAGTLEELKGRVTRGESVILAHDAKIARARSARDSLTREAASIQAKRSADFAALKLRRTALVTKVLSLKKQLPLSEKAGIAAQAEILRISKSLDDTAARFEKKIDEATRALGPLIEEKDLYTRRRQKNELDKIIEPKQKQMMIWLQLGSKAPKKEFNALDLELADLSARRRALADDVNIGLWEEDMQFKSPEQARRTIDSALTALGSQAQTFEGLLKKHRADSAAACTVLASSRSAAKTRITTAESEAAAAASEIASLDNSLGIIPADSLSIVSDAARALEKILAQQSDLDAQIATETGKRSAAAADVAQAKAALPAAQIAATGTAASSRQKTSAVRTRLEQKQSALASLPGRRAQAVASADAATKQRDALAAAQIQAQKDSIAAAEKKRLNDARLAQIAAAQAQARQDSVAAALAEKKRLNDERLVQIAAARDKARQDSISVATEKKRLNDEKLVQLAAKQKAKQDSTSAAVAEKKRQSDERLAGIAAAKEQAKRDSISAASAKKRLEEDRLAQIAAAKEQAKQDSITALRSAQRQAEARALADKNRSDSIAMAKFNRAIQDSLQKARIIQTAENQKAQQRKAVQDSLAQLRSNLYRDSVMAAIEKKKAAARAATSPPPAVVVQQPAAAKPPPTPAQSQTASTPPAPTANPQADAERDLVTIYTLIDQGKSTEARNLFASKQAFLQRYCIPDALAALRQTLDALSAPPPQAVAQPAPKPPMTAEQLMIDLYTQVENGGLAGARGRFNANREYLKNGLAKEMFDALEQTLK